MLRILAAIASWLAVGASSVPVRASDLTPDAAYTVVARDIS
jgi:hypothetical protein